MTYTSLRYLLSAPILAVFMGLVSTASAQAPGGDAERPPTDDERPGGSREASHDALLDEPESPPLPTMPARILATVGGGFSYRFVLDPNFAQGRFAPGFVDLTGAYVFAGAGTWRHAVALTLSTNVSGDGNPNIGVNPLEQYTLVPSYMAYLRFNDDWIVTVRAGLSLTTAFNVQADKSIGFALAAQLQYMFTAGAGVFVQAGTDLFFGTAWSTHPMASFGAGVVVDYEVLP
ncbi:MAG: hypothetical protein IPK60_01485 [Sandaracinaceae bacterium]|nr:hypothetical protein [Sandaracinaceae bacterium]